MIWNGRELRRGAAHGLNYPLATKVLSFVRRTNDNAAAPPPARHNVLNYLNKRSWIANVLDFFFSAQLLFWRTIIILPHFLNALFRKLWTLEHKISLLTFIYKIYCLLSMLNVFQNPSTLPWRIWSKEWMKKLFSGGRFLISPAPPLPCLSFPSFSPSPNQFSGANGPCPWMHPCKRED